MRYDLTCLRIAIKKKQKTENNKCWQVYIEKWKSCTQLMGVQNEAAWQYVPKGLIILLLL